MLHKSDEAMAVAQKIAIERQDALRERMDAPFDADIEEINQKVDWSDEESRKVFVTNGLSAVRAVRGLTELVTGQPDIMFILQGIPGVAQQILHDSDQAAMLADHLSETIAGFHAAVFGYDAPRYHPENNPTRGLVEVDFEEWARRRNDDNKSLQPSDVLQEVLDHVRELRAGIEYYKAEAVNAA